jgi:hypothetical protein
MNRPFGVTVLAVLAGVMAILATIIALRFTGILPLGPLGFRTFNLWYVLMYGLLAYIWFWVASMLWNVDYQGWIFVTFLSVLNLTINFVILVTGGEWADIQASMIINSLVLIYALLPGTKKAFEASKPPEIAAPTSE